MKARLHIESLDGRIVPDATPTNPPTPGPVETQPPEAPWTAQEIAMLRAALAQLEQWATEDTSLHAQQSHALDATQANIDQVSAALAAAAQAVANGTEPAPLQPINPPNGPNAIERVIEVAQGLRDLPGAPVQNAFRLTLESKTLFNQSVALRQQADAFAATAAALYEQARQETDPAVRSALIQAGQLATTTGTTARAQATAALTASAQKLTARAPFIQQIQDFLKDK